MKVICPRHDDQNASLELYEENGYCFVCGAVVPLEELNLEAPIKKEKEDIQKTLLFIESLPKSQLRGLLFPRSLGSYYIVWPDRSYYKQRFLEGIRYCGPTGIRPTLFTYPGHNSRLVLVEGEINCMSLKEAYQDTKTTIASFGGINNYSSYLDIYYHYETICVIVDKDSPGVVNGLNLKEILINKGKRAQLVTLPKDFNDVLVESGISGIKQICNEEGVVL